MEIYVINCQIMEYGNMCHKVVDYGKWNILSDMAEFGWKYLELEENGKSGAWRVAQWIMQLVRAPGELYLIKVLMR